MPNCNCSTTAFHNLKNATVQLILPNFQLKLTISKCLDSLLYCYCFVHCHQANSAFHPSGVGKWGPASAGKAKAGMVHSVSGWTRGVQVCEIPWERVPYLSASEVCSQQGAVQIRVYLYLYQPAHRKVHWIRLLRSLAPQTWWM